MNQLLLLVQHHHLAIRATMRIKAYPASKAQALRATGRDDEPEQGSAVPISEVIQAMRREVG